MNKIITFFTLLIIVITSCKNEVNSNDNNQNINAEEIDTSGIALKNIDSLFVRRNMKDYDQSLVSYIKSNPNRPTSTKTTIYLLPFGNIKPEVDTLIKNQVEYLEAFFQLPVKILDKISFEEILKNSNVKTRLVPEREYSYYSKMKGEIKHTENLREQIQATSFVNEYMLKNKPEDAVAVLGITEHDIYNPNYNFLFGSSNLKNGVGVISTYRLIDYSSQTENNIRKIASKQITNLFSIKNVKDYECLLNFHNNAISQANGEYKLSPRALEKLKYAIGFDYNKRFNELESFWTKEDNKEMSEYYKNVKQ